MRKREGRLAADIKTWGEGTTTTKKREMNEK